MMKRYIISFLFLTVALFLVPDGALAQPDSLFIEFDFEGFGNMVLTSPPRYAGTIYAGDPLVVGGTWWIELDDTGWPPTTDSAVRWEYIFSNYFVYDPYGYNWTAVFDGSTLPTKPIWEIVSSYGTMGGTLVVVVTISDDNQNGILEAAERGFGVFSGTLMVMKYGTGYFEIYCGQGSYNGAFFNDDPANFVDDYVEGHCLLDLINCQVGTKAVTWGAIKSMYR